ncbi:MAG: GNAT family N-acetyltransferase [Proteobacteria bacterium]|nr:GNAT family N-acetyltransferase [Pseudomonadota bacterium]
MIEIKIPTSNDATGIADVNITTWKYAFKGLIDDSYLNTLSVEKETERWSKRLSKDFSMFVLFVAKHNDKVVGFIFGEENPETKYKYDVKMIAFYVLPEYHGQGIGKKLFTAFIEESVRRNMNSMCLWCIRGNDTAKIYRHLGGEIIATDLIPIPKNGGKEYKRDVFAFDNLTELLK